MIIFKKCLNLHNKWLESEKTNRCKAQLWIYCKINKSILWFHCIDAWGYFSTQNRMKPLQASMKPSACSTRSRRMQRRPVVLWHDSKALLFTFFCTRASCLFCLGGCAVLFVLSLFLCCVFCNALPRRCLSLPSRVFPLLGYTALLNSALNHFSGE